MFAQKLVVVICNAINNRVTLVFPKVPTSCSHLSYSPRCRRPSSRSGECSSPHNTESSAWQGREKYSRSDVVKRIKQWFVIAFCKENRNMFVFPLCTGSVTAVALLFEWHLCHVAAYLQHKLSSTEEKLFLCLRDSFSTHTLGHWPMGVLICYAYVRGCLY